MNVPLIGTVAAGAPILADENVENYFPIPAELLPNSETFMLKVRGNSMIDVGIYDDDRVIVEQTSVAENGEIVVALIDDSATLSVSSRRTVTIVSSRRMQPPILIITKTRRSWRLC